MEGPKKKQRHGCLIKDFRHDGGGRSSTLNASAITLTVTPEWFYQGSTVFKTKERRNLDSRLKISGMTKKGVIPEWFYEGSKLFKGKNT